MRYRGWQVKIVKGSSTEDLEGKINGFLMLQSEHGPLADLDVRPLFAKPGIEYVVVIKWYDGY